MKKRIFALALCLVLSGASMAESAPQSASEEFLSNLGKTWDSFLNMADEAGQNVAGWAEDAGVTQWTQDRLQDLSDWAESSGAAEWARGALQDVSSWFKNAGISEWADGAAQDIQAFIEENRPAIEAWLAHAGQEVSDAWDTLIHPDAHTQAELEEAYDTVTESLEAMSGEAAQ